VIQFVDFKVRSFDLDHLDLFWEIADTAQSVDRWRIYVLKSVDGMAGPFHEIAGPFFNTGVLRDPEVNQLHNWRTYFYKLKAVNKDTDEEQEVGPEWLQAEPDLITFELRRRFNLTMQEFGGRKVLVYPAITAGFRCPACYDKGSGSRGRTIGRQLVQNCETCFDQTFVGGFAKPVEAWMQLDSEQKTNQRSDTTERTQTETSARISAFPPLKPKDMIVEAENVRWEVERVPTTKKLRAVVHQEPVLHAIPKSDIRYKVPVNIDLLQRFGPEREFTRPMSLGNEAKTPLIDMLDSMLGET
jgi:hypothetical protein